MDGTGLGSSQRSASTHSGVNAIEMITTAVSTAPVCASKMPAAAAAPYSTNANSPPCASKAARVVASACEARNARATAYTPTDFTSMNTTTAARMSGHSRATADRSRDMPTPRKNKPSRMPRNGSTSASN
ncbi:hypothetical protein FQZ97_566360 [compost metagenome]